MSVAFMDGTEVGRFTVIFFYFPSSFPSAFRILLETDEDRLLVVFNRGLILMTEVRRTFVSVDSIQSALWLEFTSVEQSCSLTTFCGDPPTCPLGVAGLLRKAGGHGKHSPPHSCMDRKVPLAKEEL